MFRSYVFLYKLTSGRFGSSLGHAPVLLLSTVGRKTGKLRTTPVLYLTDGDNLVVVASNAGNDKHPSWWINLKHNPKAQVQIKRKKRNVRAEKASEEEKSRLWPLLTNMFPRYNDYQNRTKRELPVVILKPAGES